MRSEGYERQRIYRGETEAILVSDQLTIRLGSPADVGLALDVPKLRNGAVFVVDPQRLLHYQAGLLLLLLQAIDHALLELAHFEKHLVQAG